MGRVVSGSRYLFVFAVFALLAIALVLIVYGTAEVVVAIKDMILDPEFGTGGTKEITLEAIEVVDVFLLGIAVFVLGIGIYTLFVADLDLAESLQIHSLAGMKSVLASTVVVVLGVAYLGVLLRQGDALEKGLTGLGTAAVIAALAYYIRGHRRD